MGKSVKNKLRTCKAKGCREKFYPINSFHVACCPKCAIIVTEAKKKKKEATARKENKKRLDELQPYSYWVKRAQAAFNRYIRLRDKGKPCISCGRSTGCKVNAGHYLSVGSSKGLRFHPFNASLQCEHCNTYKSGNQAEYRINLIKKIGLANVEWLENNRNGYTPTVGEVKEIEAHYKQLTKEYVNEN